MGKAVKGMSILQTTGVILLFILAYGILLVSCENKIIYHPFKYPDGMWEPGQVGVQVEDIYFNAADGAKLHGWYIAAPEPKATVIWYHGNAGNITHRLENILRLKPLNWNIFIFDYRGYGRSEGSPTEEGLYLDSQAAYDTLIREKKPPLETLFIFGRSLGGVFALEVALNNSAAGLILETTFTSAKDMVKKIFPFLPLGWAISSELNAIQKVSSVRIPKLFLHGTEDEVVPFKLGRQLFEAAPEPKEFYAIKGANHNNTYIVGGESYFAALGNFIKRHSASGSNKAPVGG